MSPPSEQLIRAYLKRLSVAARGQLGPDDQRELVKRTRHLIELKVGLAASPTTMEIGKVLAGLGDPTLLVERERKELAAARGELPEPVASRNRIARVLRRDPTRARAASWRWPVQEGTSAGGRLTLLDGGTTLDGGTMLVDVPTDAGVPASPPDPATAAPAAGRTASAGRTAPAGTTAPAGASAPAGPASPASPAGTAAAAGTGAAGTGAAGTSTAGTTTAGTTTTATSTAGTATAGTATAGTATAGTSTAGTSTAGTSTAGTSTAGTSTAGTSTAATSTAATTGTARSSAAGTSAAGTGAAQTSGPGARAGPNGIARHGVAREAAQAGAGEPAASVPAQTSEPSWFMLKLGGRATEPSDQMADGPPMPDLPAAVPAKRRRPSAPAGADGRTRRFVIFDSNPSDDSAPDDASPAWQLMTPLRQVVSRQARRASSAVAAWYRRTPLEASAVVLLGLGGVIYPPVWLIGAAVALASRLWDYRDKWIGLALPLLLTLIGTVVGAASGVQVSVGQGVHEGWVYGVVTSRLAAALSAAYLGWRSSRGRRPPADPPWLHKVG